MFENLLDRAKIVGGSVKANLDNSNEKRNISIKKESLQEDLEQKYNSLGKTFFKDNQYSVPETYKEQFHEIQDLLKQIAQCDEEVAKSDASLVAKKEELQQRKTEIAEKERLAKEEKAKQAELKKKEETKPETGATTTVTGKKYCPSCGALIDDDCKFCTQCGTKLEITETEEQVPVEVIPEVVEEEPVEVVTEVVEEQPTTEEAVEVITLEEAVDPQEPEEEKTEEVVEEISPVEEVSETAVSEEVESKEE